LAATSCWKKKDPHELLFDLRALTGPDGKWQTSGAPETTGEMLGFRVVHPDFLSSRDYSQQEIIPKPKFQGYLAGILIAINSLRQFGLPVSGYILINRNASACNASVSVTW
jgi:hypothetical protein